MFFLIALAMLALFAGVAAMFASTELPDLDPLEQSTFICDAAVPENCNPQNAIASIQGGEDRINVSYEDLPQHLIDAVVAMEDRDFFEHQGIDPMGIVRALYRDLRGGGQQQGGSTITQQYVKNVFLSHERSISRKINEAILSVKLEQRMSKEEILEGYLNTIYFGRWAYGVQAASQAYFGKDVGGLDIAESAYLAGLIRAPALADATNHPEEAARRRHTALVAMLEEGYITEAELEEADAVPFAPPNFLPLTDRANFETRAPIRDYGGDYITQYVRHLLETEHHIPEEEILGGGLRVYTSIDWQMQQAAWDAIKTVLTSPDDPAAALVAVDDQGLVRAMVGGPGFVPGEDETNYAVRGLGSQGRQVGSAFKPIALAEAMRRNWSLDTRYDAPATKEIAQNIPGCAPVWPVRNYNESEEGQLDLVNATRVSSNTAFGQLMVDLGPDTVNALAHDLGIQEVSENPCGPTVLGSDNATPLEMATVYSTFANRGVRRDPDIITRIEQVDQGGNVSVLYERVPEERQVLTQAQADRVTYALQGVIQGGTGTGADIGRPAAGKTGTTTNNKDAWFVGFVPRLTAAVWMGYPDADWVNPETGQEEIPPMNQSGRMVQGLASVTGGSLPARIWANFMGAVTDARGMNDEFIQLDATAVHDGEVMGTTTVATQPPPPMPVPPGSPGPGPGNGNGPPTTTTSSSSSTTTSVLGPTLPTLGTSTTTTDPGNGHGGGGG